MSSLAPPPPLVTIGLPVYNGANFVQEAIASIQAQDFRDFELVISDNASTDETAAICEAAAVRDRRIRYYRQPSNQGAAWNYQAVFDLATGEYFKWAAHDDVLEPGFLSACVAAFRDNPRLVLAYPSTVLIDAEGEVTGCYIDRLDSESDDPVERFSRWMKWGNHWCSPIFGVMPRSVMQLIKPMDIFDGSDHVFLAELALKGRCRRLPVGYMLRRIHSGMSTQANASSLELASHAAGRALKGLRFRWWRLLAEYALAIRRSDLSLSQRIRAMMVLGRWAFSFSPKLFKELLLPLYVNGRPTALNLWLRGRLGLDARKARREARRR